MSGRLSLPVVVGSWWFDPDLGPCVVTGEPFVVDESGTQVVYVRFVGDSEPRGMDADMVRCVMTPLDGPPEPLVGSVYVIGRQVFTRAAEDIHWTAGSGESLTWPVVCDVWSDRMGALRILGTVTP